MRRLQQMTKFGPSPSPAPSLPLNPATGLFGSPLSFDMKQTLLYVGVSICVLVLGTVLISVGIFFCLRPRRREREAALELQRQRNAALQEVKVEEAFKPKIRPFPVLILQPGSAEVVFGASDDSIFGDQANSDKLDKASTMSSILSTDLSDLSRSWYQNSVSQGMHTSNSHTSLASLGGFTPRESADSDVLRGEGSTHPAPLQAVHEQPQAEELLDTGDAGSIHAELQTRPSEPELVFYNPMTHFLTEQRPRLFTANVEYKEADLQ